MYIDSENKYICDFCGREFVKNSCYGSYGMREEGWDVISTRVTYPVEKKVFKNWFSYSETTERKTKIELKCDVCIRKDKINKLKNAIHTR